MANKSRDVGNVPMKAKAKDRAIQKDVITLPDESGVTIAKRIDHTE